MPRKQFFLTRSFRGLAAHEGNGDGDREDRRDEQRALPMTYVSFGSVIRPCKGQDVGLMLGAGPKAVCTMCSRLVVSPRSRSGWNHACPRLPGVQGHRQGRGRS